MYVCPHTLAAPAFPQFTRVYVCVYVCLCVCAPASVAPGGTGNGEYGACTGRGTCSGSPQYVCSCDNGFYGGACEFGTFVGDCRTDLVEERGWADAGVVVVWWVASVDCPSHTAWADLATADDTAHAYAPCSNRVRCVGACVATTAAFIDV